MARKVYVEVLASFDKTGKMMPVSVIWEDGRTFKIDKVLDVRRAASLKAGGQGIRYSCRIMGKEINLFFDDPLWFVEVNEV